MTSPARLELIHTLIQAAVKEDLPNFEIENRIIGFTQGLEERREAFEYLTLLRTVRGEDLNQFTGISNVRDQLVRAEPRVATSRPHEAPTTATAPHKGPGPTPLSPEAVEASRQKLKEAGKPSGERSIAADLGRSRDAVRYALGKDRRTRRP